MESIMMTSIMTLVMLLMPMMMMTISHYDITYDVDGDDDIMNIQGYPCCILNFGFFC